MSRLLSSYSDALFSHGLTALPIRSGDVCYALSLRGCGSSPAGAVAVGGSMVWTSGLSWARN